MSYIVLAEKDGSGRVLNVPDHYLTAVEFYERIIAGGETIRVVHL